MPTIGQVWKHVKSGGEYEIMEMGKLQVKGELDMADCVIYRSLQVSGEFKEGSIWIRPVADFVEMGSGGEPRFILVK
jgi:hypothetical protein